MIYTDKIHMVADTLDELHQFAQKIGLSRAYFEGVKKGHPHYDLVNERKYPLYDSFGKKIIDKVIENGAKVVRDRVIVEISKKLINPNKNDNSNNSNTEKRGGKKGKA